MVLENPVELVVPENPGVPVVLVVPVVLENPAVPAELIVQVEAVPVQNHRPAQLAVALRTKSVIAAHRPDLAPLLEAAVDLVAVAETTPEPAAAEAVRAWEAADTAAVVEVVVTVEAAVVVAALAAAVAEDAAVAAEDVAVAAEDAEDNQRR